MKKVALQRFVLALCSFLILNVFFDHVQASPQTGRATDEPVLKVGLWSNQSSILISSDTELQLLDDNTGQVVAQASSNDKLIISTKNGQIAINGTTVAAREISVSSKTTEKNPHYIEVNRRRYRGDIQIHRTFNKAGLTVVNTLPVEQYLYGIIGREISPEWPLEAVKAQAVAARTYALYNRNKHGKDGYDLCATNDCQVYGGMESEAPQVITAVDATRGMVLLYQGKLIPACFHSSGGGYTENSENVWGTYLPYLRGVVDYDQRSPHYKWERRYTPNQWIEEMNSSGINIGKLHALELSVLRPVPVISPDRGVSGRIKSLRMIGDNGSVELTGSRLRSILNLPSTLFDIKIVVPGPQAVEFSITDSYGDIEQKKVDINLPLSQQRGLVTDKEAIRRITGRTGEVILLTGFGWGHGVGLSQWGAKAMAEKAPKDATTFYLEILKHYYTGVDVQKSY